MQINKQALKRLQESSITPEAIVATLEQICNGCNMFDVGGSQLPLDYQNSETKLEPGDLIPFIVIGLRPPTVEEEPGND